MNNWKVLAIIFSFFSFEAVRETFRIFTSPAPDIARNRLELEIMSVVITIVIIFFTLRFWKKASDNRLY